MKARVTHPDGGFTYHRLDNVPVEVVNGQTIELDEIPPRERVERINDGHVTPLAAEETTTTAKRTRAAKTKTP